MNKQFIKFLFISTLLLNPITAKALSNISNETFNKPENTINYEIFRENDIRGIAQTDLTDEIVMRIGKAVGTLLQNQLDKSDVTITVGWDARLNSKRIRKSYIQGLLQSGINAIDIGLVPTGITYFSQYYLKSDSASMITASHSPAEWGGIKNTIGSIEDIKKKFSSGLFLTGLGTYKKENIINAYNTMVKAIMSLGLGNWHSIVQEKGLREAIEYASDMFDNSKPLQGLKIVIDSSNGAVGSIAGEIFEALGSEVVGINTAYDGNFSAHTPDCSKPEALMQAIEKVKETDSDLGIIYDGDGDRAVAVSGKGEFIFGDALLALLSYDILKRHPGSKILCDPKVSQSVLDCIISLGGKAVIVPTGYTYMKQGLSEISDAWIGGEYSGHICPKEYFNIDDGIVTSALLLQYVAQLKENGKTLDDILDQFPHYEGTPEIRFSGPNEVLQRRNIVQKIKEEFIQEGYDINDIDGVRATFKSENGWALIRSSNTGPQFTLRAEAKTYEGLEAILDIMLKKIQKAYPEGNIKNLKNK